MNAEPLPNQRIICFGDSITAGRRQPELCRWTALVQQTLEQLSPGHWEVFNRGVPGDTVRNGLDRFDKDIAPLLPGWVLVEFGINDASIPQGRRISRVGPADFKDGLEEVLRLVVEGGGSAVLLTNHPVGQSREGSEGSLQDRLKPYQEIIRCVAADSGFPLIDMESHFQSLPASRHLAEDGVHLSRQGNLDYACGILKGLARLGIPLREESMNAVYNGRRSSVGA